jgi:hypothetical protein
MIPGARSIDVGCVMYVVMVELKLSFLDLVGSAVKPYNLFIL